VKPKTSRLYAYRGAARHRLQRERGGFYVTLSLTMKIVEEAGRACSAFRLQPWSYTRGEKGMSIFEETARNLHVPATSFEVT